MVSIKQNVSKNRKQQELMNHSIQKNVFEFQVFSVNKITMKQNEFFDR